MTRPALKTLPTGIANPDGCEVECADCDGRGTVPPSGNAPYWEREMEECYECNGRGYVELEARYCDDCDFSTVDQDCVVCPECRGCVA